MWEKMAYKEVILANVEYSTQVKIIKETITKFINNLGYIKIKAMKKNYIVYLSILSVLLASSLFLIVQGPSISTSGEEKPVTNLTTITIQTTVQRSEVLFSGKDLLIPFLGYGHIGPYYISVGRTLKILWEADTSVNVYVLNDVDWKNTFFGVPTRWRAFKTGERGSLEYYVEHYEPLYVVVLCPTLCSAKLYYWEVEVVWIENVEQTIVQTFTILKTETKATYIRNIGFILGLVSSIVMSIILFKHFSEQNIRRTQDANRHENLIQELEELKVQRDRLRTLFQRGEIKKELYEKLENEMVAKIEDIRNKLVNERKMYENEMSEVEEKIRRLKDDAEELRIRRGIGMIDGKTFQQRLQQIRMEFRELSKRREYLKYMIKILTSSEEE
jgi:multisubunit Na+/H+ antiporter MnhF subunit